MTISTTPLTSPTIGMKSIINDNTARNVNPNAASDAAPDCPKQSENAEQLSAAAGDSNSRIAATTSQHEAATKRIQRHSVLTRPPPLSAAVGGHRGRGQTPGPRR